MSSITIYLIGFAGSGKYTIAKEITNSGYKVVDNQLINNPIFSLLDLDGITSIPQNAWAAIADIRKAVLSYVSQDSKSNYVLTNELCEVEHDHVIYNRVKKSAETRGSKFVPVKLTILAEERARRITDPDRIDRWKSTNVAETEVQKEFIKIDHPHLLELDVTALSAMQAAAEILRFAVDSH